MLCKIKYRNSQKDKTCYSNSSVSHVTNQYMNLATWNWRLMKTIMTTCHVYSEEQNYVAFDEIAPEESQPITLLKKVMPDCAWFLGILIIFSSESNSWFAVPILYIFFLLSMQRLLTCLVESRETNNRRFLEVLCRVIYLKVPVCGWVTRYVIVNCYWWEEKRDQIGILCYFANNRDGLSSSIM